MNDPDAAEALVDDDRTAADLDDRTLRLNEAAIGDVRSEVSAAVSEIDGALDRLREVLDSRLGELRLPDNPIEGGAL